MRKIGFILLSFIPGMAFAKNAVLTSKVLVTARIPENVVNAIPTIQSIILGLGASRINLTIDSQRNSIEVLLPKGESADVLVGKLKSLLGDSVSVEKISSDSITFGTQDDIMKL